MLVLEYDCTLQQMSKVDCMDTSDMQYIQPYSTLLNATCDDTRIAVDRMISLLYTQSTHSLRNLRAETLAVSTIQPPSPFPHLIFPLSCRPSSPLSTVCPWPTYIDRPLPAPLPPSSAAAALLSCRRYPRLPASTTGYEGRS